MKIIIGNKNKIRKFFKHIGISHRKIDSKVTNSINNLEKSIDIIIRQALNYTPTKLLIGKKLENEFQN